MHIFRIKERGHEKGPYEPSREGNPIENVLSKSQVGEVHEQENKLGISCTKFHKVST